MKRTLASLLIAAMLLTALPLSSAAVGEPTTEISGGLTYRSVHETFAGSPRQSYLLNYTPNERTVPIVLYGHRLYGTSNIREITAYAEQLGYTVMAAVNSDYFSLNTGLPTGMTVQDGRLVTSDGSWNAVGFRADNTALVGAPGLRLTLTDAAGASMPVYALNKLRTAAGLYLYSADFSETTRTTLPGVEVLLEVDDARPLAIGQTVEATVLERSETGATPLSEGQLVLSLQNGNLPGLTLDGLAVGDRVSISVSANEGWEEVVWCTGGGNMLAVDGALTSEATAGTDPRTLLGVRENGSILVLVCDGRQKTVSTGISLRDGAQLLLDCGCVSVVALDGGGSSAVSARLPGEDGASLRSSPSDGAPRGCATYLLFVNTGDPTLPADGAAVYPHEAALLAGAALPLTARSYNADYFPTGVYDGALTVTEGGGTLTDGILTAPAEAGVVRVGIDDPTLRCIEAAYTVSDRPTALHLAAHGSKTALTSLALEPGESFDLDVLCDDGTTRLIAQDTQFAFSLPALLGTVDESGVLTAGELSGVHGKLTVSYGDVQTVLPVTVGHVPTLLEDFEAAPTWSVRQDGDALPDASVKLNTAPENSRYGFNSLILTARDAEGAVFAPDKALALPKGARNLSFAAHGGTGALLFRGSDGSEAAVPFDAGGSDWRFCTAAVPEDASALSGIRLDGAGKLTLDRFTVHYGPVSEDLQPPTVTVEITDGLTLRASVLDDSVFPVERAQISVRLDGTALDFDYDADTGVLQARLPQEPGQHRLVITARDVLGNAVRTAKTYGERITDSYSDLAHHWGADYAEYLHLRGVFSSAAKFDPNGLVTNAMAATIMSRYLGVDTALYADVELPYSDAADIPSWALPHVRAMYAMGIMRGSTLHGQPILYPNEPCSRAQIMTVLGRSLGRGYLYEPAQFSDFGDTPGWASDHVSLLTGLGIVGGDGGKTGTVRPNGTITRAEFASLLFKLG